MASIWDYILAGGGGAAEGGRAAETLGLQRSAQDLERSKLRADLFMQGFDPAAASGPSPAQPSQPTAPTAPVAPSGPAPVAPMAPVAPPGPPAMPAIPAPQGPGPSVPQVRIRGGMAPATPAVDAMRAAAGASPTSPPSPSPAPSSPGGFDLGAFMRTNGQAVDLPGIGRFQYNFDRSPIMREATIESLKKHVDTDEAIRQSNATGQTLKNLRDAARLQIGDPGYAPAMGEVAGAESAARLPADIQKAVRESQLSLQNGIVLERLRSSAAAALQSNQQQFEAGKMTAEQKFAADQQVKRIGDEYLNRSAEITQQARDGLWGRLWAPSPGTVPPSAKPSGASTVLQRFNITPTTQF